MVHKKRQFERNQQDEAFTELELISKPWLIPEVCTDHAVNFV